VQAIRDYITNEDSSLLSFKKNDIIKIINKSYTPQGWLRGVLSGRKGLFPIEYVRPLPRSELTDLNKVRPREFGPFLFFISFFPFCSFFSFTNVKMKKKTIKNMKTKKRYD
jgi:hypothetical protein